MKYTLALLLLILEPKLQCYKSKSITYAFNSEPEELKYFLNGSNPFPIS